MKRWDYYAVFTPQRFFSATIANLGYAGNIFVYTLDFASHELHEEGLVIPLGRGVELPRNSEQGISSYRAKASACVSPLSRSSAACRSIGLLSTTGAASRPTSPCTPRPARN